MGHMPCEADSRSVHSWASDQEWGGGMIDPGATNRQVGAAEPHQPLRAQLRVLEGIPRADSTPADDRQPDMSPPQGDPGETIARLRLELEAVRDENQALRQMLEDLPDIFETKFRQRQRAFTAHQDHLRADNKALRARLYALAPAAETQPPLSTLPALPPGRPEQRVRRAPWLRIRPLVNRLGHLGRRRQPPNAVD